MTRRGFLELAGKVGVVAGVIAAVPPVVLSKPAPGDIYGPSYYYRRGIDIYESRFWDRR